MGRPSEYTPERGEAILARLAVGESLRSICTDEGMPHRDTVRAWCDVFPEFSGQYARAREIGLDNLADEVLEIADDVFVDSDAIQKAKLQVDARKWLLSKLAPKKYGDKVALEHSTPPGQPIQVQATADPESLAQLAGIIGELTGAPRSGESARVTPSDEDAVPGTSRGGSTSAQGDAS